MAIWASSAPADTGDIVAPSDPNDPQVDSGWQAGTCTEEPPKSTVFCSVDTPDQFFEQAAGHPQWGFTQIIVKHKTEEPVPGLTLEKPEGELRTVHVDLPVGLSVNPQATPQCKQKDFEALPTPTCPVGSEVGKSIVVAADPLVGLPLPPLEATVYNIEPPVGEPARFGFNLAGNNVYLRADVAWDGDYHEGFTIDVPEAPKLEPIIEGLILKNRLVFNGRSGNGTFITTPTTCLGEAPQGSPFEHVYSTWLRADSYAIPDPNFPNGSSFFESKIPPETFPKECDSIPFDPSIGVDPSTTQTDSPAGIAGEIKLPFEVPTALEKTEELTKQASSNAKQAKVTLPLGMGLNPSAAGGGLQTCTDAQFGLHTRNDVGCPAASKIGTVAINTPPLPDGSLTGNVYVGKQLSRDPTSGEEYRIFVDAESARYGISARLVGNVSANPLTGVLTTTFDDKQFGGLPQVPFRTFTLDFDDGPRAVLTSPPTCGPHTTTTQMIPWSSTPGTIPGGTEGGSSTDPPATPSSEFTLTNAPGGGACAKTGAARPFAPSFAARTAKPRGGTYSPLRVDIARADGNQELKGVEVDLPPGLSAKLAGVRYCPPSTLAAAAANSGIVEAASSSCPNASLIGVADVSAGSGPSPIHIAGKVFLAGRYKGAPLSLAVVTPATAGPFDLGTVVVRVALFVDPETAQVHAVSDAIPHVYGGALLDVRSIAVRTDRPKFTLNPTNCSPMAIGATLRGGANDANNPAAFSSYAASTPFQASNCDALDFKPKLFMRLFGATRRAKNPKLRAVLVARDGDANIGRAAVTLPRALILDQANLAKVCTRVQFAAHDCPKKSIYGYARAFTPLLDGPLEGPVYLRSSNNTLPDLVSDLNGQVEIVLDSRTDSVRGRIRNTFDAVPDVPVSKFVLALRGGPKGLLVNSRNLCPKHGKGQKGKGPKPLRALARFKAQNGKKRNLRPKLRTSCTRRRHR
jgi:hypothetical protein